MTQKNAALRWRKITCYPQYIVIRAMKKVHSMFFKQLRYRINYLLENEIFILIIIIFVIQVDLVIDKIDDFIVYQAVDQYVIEEQMLSDVDTFTFNKIISYFWKQKELKLDPFEPSCFSIKTNANFKIRIRSIGKS